jgi:hypothetical protein
MSFWRLLTSVKQLLLWQNSHCSTHRKTEVIILGDSKWLWIIMATMYENLCGNCVGDVELTFVWHFISVHLIFFLYHCTMIWQFSKLRGYELSKKCQLYPTHTVATYSFVHSCHIYPQSFWITQYHVVKGIFAL